MATVQIMYWQEIPSIVEAKDDSGTHKEQLSERYQALIDFAAMKRKLDGSDDYLMQWHKEAAGERDGSAADVWTANLSPEGEEVLQLTFHIPLHGHPTVDGLYDAWKRQADVYTYDLAGDDLESYRQFMADHQAGPLTGAQEEPPGLSRRVFHFFPFPEGAVSIVTPEPLPEEALQVMRQIRNVFSFAYTRYLDLKQAEEQAREAQIEAALEPQNVLPTMSDAATQARGRGRSFGSGTTGPRSPSGSGPSTCRKAPAPTGPRPRTPRRPTRRSAPPATPSAPPTRWPGS